MKNLILILLLSATFACKKKDVKPEPAPVEQSTTTGTVVCKTDLKVFAGRWKDVKQNTIDILFVKDYCPTISNKNQYNVVNFGDVNNKYTGQHIHNKDRLIDVVEVYSGDNIMKIDGNGDGKLTSLVISSSNKNKMIIEFPTGNIEFSR